VIFRHNLGDSSAWKKDWEGVAIPWERPKSKSIHITWLRPGGLGYGAGDWKDFFWLIPAPGLRQSRRLRLFLLLTTLWTGLNAGLRDFHPRVPRFPT